MRNKIAVIPGDGIGPEVTDEALKVLKSAGQRFGFGIKPTHYPWSGEHILKRESSCLPPRLEEYRQHDAILPPPRCDRRSPARNRTSRARGRGRCRFGLDLYVNLRPIKLYAPHLCPLKNDDPKIST